MCEQLLEYRRISADPHIMAALRGNKAYIAPLTTYVMIVGAAKAAVVIPTTRRNKCVIVLALYPSRNRLLGLGYACCCEGGRPENKKV
jgi:hypothetical protein